MRQRKARLTAARLSNIVAVSYYRSYQAALSARRYEGSEDEGHRGIGARRDQGHGPRPVARLLHRQARLCRNDAAPQGRRQRLAGLSAHHRRAVSRGLSRRRKRSRAGLERERHEPYLPRGRRHRQPCSRSSTRPASRCCCRSSLRVDGNRQAWIEDPDGNRIELMEMAPDSLQLKAVERLRAGPALA